MNKSLCLWNSNYKRPRKKAATLLFALFSVCLIHAQHKYYFASGTSDGNGTIEQPFTSLDKLSELKLRPADTVFFLGGHMIKGNIILNNIHGSEKANVVFMSYGKGMCTIYGEDREAFVIAGSSYFQIVNLSLVGSGRKAGNTTDGLKIVNCENAKIKDLEVSGFQKAGLLLFNSQSAEASQVFAHDNGLAGILVEGDYKKRMSRNIKIVNCHADDNPGDPTNLDNHSGNGILVGNCRNVLIDYCTATNNGWDMPRIGNGPVGIWAYEADSVIIQHCIAYRNKTAKGAADGGGFDLDGGVTNSIIQYCLSYENWGSGYGIFQYDGADKWYNNTVRYCISINDGFVTDHACGMLIWNGSNVEADFTRFYAYNNVIYNDKKYAFAFLDQSSHDNFHFFNNVFVASDSSDIFDGIDSSKSDIFLGNVWMRRSGGFQQRGFSNLEEWSKNTRHEQLNGKFSGSSFSTQLFSLPATVDITNPYSLNKDRVLLSICNDKLRNKGVDIRKIYRIDAGKKDFFGYAIQPAGPSTPGVCVNK